MKKFLIILFLIFSPLTACSALEEINDNFFEFSLKIQAYDASLNDKFGQSFWIRLNKGD